MAESVLAVDLGGTTMRAAVVEPDGRVALRRTLPTPREQTCPDALLALVGEAVLGAGRGPGDLVYLTVSTGVGAAGWAQATAGLEASGARA